MASRWRQCFNAALPQTLLGRLSAALVAAVLLSQIVGNLIWSAQNNAEAEAETASAAQSIAHSALSAMRFFLSLPPSYHQIIIQQFREMGGTRFFATINDAPVDITAIEQQPLAKLAVRQVSATLATAIPSARSVRVAFAWPGQLKVSDAGAAITDLPDSWVQHIVLSHAKPAPILVIQAELAPQRWLYLATLMPNPYFLDDGKLFTSERLLLQGMTLMFVLAVALFAVRWSTDPLAKLSNAAEAFGRGEPMPQLPQSGSREFISTARAFSAMHERMQRYIEERERLFVGISHDLRTPIMRLKLRVELLDDDDVRVDFHEDLDELDMMLKAALQHVQDSNIHENMTTIRLDALLTRMVRDARLAGHVVSYGGTLLSVMGKPLALKRSIGNLLDNALLYGSRVEIEVRESDGEVSVEIRDHGPGVPAEAMETLFDPSVRLDHGRRRNSAGMGLGLGIARGLVQSMDGKLVLLNHPQGGLAATIVLAAGSASIER
jgi:signal transduction histidine kinase